MQHSEIVLALLLPADQEPPEAVQPAVRPLDHPASGSVAYSACQRFGFFAPCVQVQGVEELLGQLPHLVVVVAFVQQQSLRLLRRRLGPSNRNALEGFPRQLEVGPVGASDGDAEGHARPVGQQASLRAALGSVRGIGTGFFPHPTALSSSRHREPASPTRCHGVPRTPGARGSTVRGTLPPRSTLGNGDAHYFEQDNTYVRSQQMPVAESASHWQPVRSTNKMASMALRSGTRGLWQPSGCGLPGGISGCISAQSSSGRRQPSSSTTSPMARPPSHVPCYREGTRASPFLLPIGIGS